MRAPRPNRIMGNGGGYRLDPGLKNVQNATENSDKPEDPPDWRHRIDKPNVYLRQDVHLVQFYRP